MATVTTTVTPSQEVITFEGLAPRANYQGDQPIGKLVLLAQEVIPSKLAADENQILMTSTLPPNFFYRISFNEVFLAGTALASFRDNSGFELAFAGLISEGAVSKYHWSMVNELAIGGADIVSGLTFAAAKQFPDSVTNDWMATYRPSKCLKNYFIDAGSQAAVVQQSWMDTSADATTATALTWLMELYMYTVRQGNAVWANDEL